MKAGRITAELVDDEITEDAVVRRPRATLGQSHQGGSTCLTQPPPNKQTILQRINWVDLGPFIALAVLVVVGYLINPDFLSPTNLSNVLTRSTFIAIIAVGRPSLLPREG